MDVQVIEDKMPLCRSRIAGNQALDMDESIFLGACWPPGGLDDLSSSDIKIDKPRQGAMSDVLEFASQYMAGQHRQVGILAL
jgi:hypothetical protein